MTLDEIKSAVEAGKKVCWENPGYEVIKDSIGQWLVKRTDSDYCFGLTWRDGVTVNGEPDEFFVLDGTATIPPAPAAVLAALAHVRSIFPEVVMVVFQRDGRWMYMDSDFGRPVFDDRVDTGLLKDASDAVVVLPAVFELIQPAA